MCRMIITGRKQLHSAQVCQSQPWCREQHSASVRTQLRAFEIQITQLWRREKHRRSELVVDFTGERKSSQQREVVASKEAKECGVAWLKRSRKAMIYVSPVNQMQRLQRRRRGRNTGSVQANRVKLAVSVSLAAQLEMSARDGFATRRGKRCQLWQDLPLRASASRVSRVGSQPWHATERAKAAHQVVSLAERASQRQVRRDPHRGAACGATPGTADQLRPYDL